MFEHLFSQAGLSLDRLRALVEVDAAGGIAATAPGDVVRQSQLSRNLSQLEVFFGIELKRRRGKGIELTAEGKRLALLAREYLHSLDDFLNEARSVPVQIRIGAGHSTLEWLVLPGLNALGGIEPRPEIVLENRRAHEVVAGLNDFSLDLGIVRKSAITTKRLLTRPFARFGYSLFCRKAVAKRFGNDAGKILTSAPLALTAGGDFRRRFDAHCLDRNLVPRVAYSCSSFRLAVELLKQEEGLAVILPDPARDGLSEEDYAGLPIPGFETEERELVLAWHERIEDLRPVAGRVKDLLGRE